MTEVSLDRALLPPGTFGDWYRARPFQIAFALSVVVHAGLIAWVPGFRTQVAEPPTVLSVSIVQPEEPRLRMPQVPVPPPPKFVPLEPQRPLPTQAIAEPRPQIEPPPTPELRQPAPAQKPVAMAELAPPVPRERALPEPVTQARPRPVPEQAVAPLIERLPAPDLERPILSFPPVARVEPRPQPAALPRPDPVPVPVASRPEPRIEMPVVKAPVAPPPVARVEPRPQPETPAPTIPVPQAPPPVQAQITAPPPTIPVPAVPSPVQTQITAPPPIAVAEPVRSTPVREDAEVVRALSATFSQQVSSKIKRFQRYPMVAQRRGWEGTAEVLVRFDPDGRVADIVLGKSSGREILDEEAVNMVRRASPLPEAPQGLFGKEIKVPIIFRLQDS